MLQCVWLDLVARVFVDSHRALRRTHGEEGWWKGMLQGSKVGVCLCTPSTALHKIDVWRRTEGGKKSMLEYVRDRLKVIRHFFCGDKVGVWTISSHSFAVEYSLLFFPPRGNYAMILPCTLNRD